MKDGLYWAELLRKKEISFQELLKKFEERVLKQNSALNAFVTIMEQEALKEYEKLDNILDRPFAGLPIPLKMLGQEKKGWLSTSGSKLLREHHASHSSNFTNQLVANGLIPFAQTNTPEFGFKNITDAQIYGSVKIHGILTIILAVLAEALPVQSHPESFRSQEQAMAAVPSESLPRFAD